MTNSRFYTIDEILNSVFNSSSLAVEFHTIDQVLNTIYDESNSAIKVNITNMSASSDHSVLSNRDVAGNHAKLIPASDTVTAIQITKADGTTALFNVDSTNSRFGFNTTSSATQVHLYAQDTDLEADDQTNDITMDGGLNSDKGLIWADQGNSKWQQNIYREEEGKYMYVYNFDNGREIIVFSDSMKMSVNKQSNIMNYHVCYMDLDNGALDDCEMGGYFDNTQITLYDIKISSTGATDTYKWRRSRDYGSTWTAYSADIPCHINEVELEHGVTLLFGAVNGHNLYDQWKVYAFPQEPNGTVTIAPPFINEINAIIDYTIETPLYRDLTFTLSCNDMPDQDIFELGVNSALYVGRHVKFGNLFIDVTIPAVGVTLVCEYWDGASWVALDSSVDYTDGTSNLTQVGVIHWDKGALTWEKRNPEHHPTGDGYNLYWLRLRSSTAVTEQPHVRTIVTQGLYRFATYAAHNDALPCFYVDAKGRTVIGDARINPYASLTINGSQAQKFDEIYNIYYFR